MIEDTADEAPVLRAFPGDKILFTIKNENYPASLVKVSELKTNGYCHTKFATNTSTSVHFHGLHSPPVCHDDSIIMTVVNSGDAFTYAVAVPISQPAGMLWYHPHVHGIARLQVMGGASGILMIEGMEKVQPKVAGLFEQVLVFRDFSCTHSVCLAKTDPNSPSTDLSLNFVPILYPEYKPVHLAVKPEQEQFFRIANAASDTELNVTFLYDGVPQKFQVVALDGVSVGKGTSAETFEADRVFLAVGSRVEIILKTPALGQTAVMWTDRVIFTSKTGGSSLPRRPLLNMTASVTAQDPPNQMPEADIRDDDFEPHKLIDYSSRVPTDLAQYDDILGRRPVRTRTFAFTQHTTPENFAIHSGEWIDVICLRMLLIACCRVLDHGGGA